jgi:hypothetical protein
MSKMTIKDLIESTKDATNKPIDSIKKDNKIIGNINLNKINTLNDKINVTHKEVLNYEKLTISYDICVNDIVVGSAHKESDYNGTLYFSFTTSYSFFSFKENSYTLSSLKQIIILRIEEIQSFIKKFD